MARPVPEVAVRVRVPGGGTAIASCCGGGCVGSVVVGVGVVLGKPVTDRARLRSPPAR